MCDCRGKIITSHLFLVNNKSHHMRINLLARPISLLMKLRLIQTQSEDMIPKHAWQVIPQITTDSVAKKVKPNKQGFYSSLPRWSIAHNAYLPRTWSIMPFCACNRFSACGKMIDFGPSITSSVTSTPFSAGKQCMKSAFDPAISIRLWSTCRINC